MHADTTAVTIQYNEIVLSEVKGTPRDILWKKPSDLFRQPNIYICGGSVCV